MGKENSWTTAIARPSVTLLIGCTAAHRYFVSLLNLDNVCFLLKHSLFLIKPKELTDLQCIYYLSHL